MMNRNTRSSYFLVILISDGSVKSYRTPVQFLQCWDYYSNLSYSCNNCSPSYISRIKVAANVVRTISFVHLISCMKVGTDVRCVA